MTLVRDVARLSWLGLSLALLAASSAVGAADSAEREVTRFARSSNAFGLDLYHSVKDRPGNVAFSPSSVSIALSLAWPGARAATATEMKRVLHLADAPEAVMRAVRRVSSDLEGDGVRITCGLFGEQSLEFEPAFVESVETADGFLEAADFKATPEVARARINGWVEERTRGRIRELLSPRSVDKATLLVIVSAIHFKGEWVNPFEPDATAPAPFHVSRGLRKDVATMHGTVAVRFAHHDGVKALELPYVGDHISMLFLLPDAVDGLKNFEDSLTQERLDRLVARLTTRLVTVSLPRFNVSPEESSSLRENLERIGMGVVFDPVRADFTGMARSRNPADRLFIDEVLHNAFVNVWEQGTEAAAATAALGSLGAGPPLKVAEFRADHPFLFLIRDARSTLVVFLGRVADPAEN